MLRVQELGCRYYGKPSLGIYICVSIYIDLRHQRTPVPNLPPLHSPTARDSEKAAGLPGGVRRRHGRHGHDGPGLRHGHLQLRAWSGLLGHRLRGQPQGLHYLGLNDGWYPEVYVSLGYPSVDAYASASVDIYDESHVHQEKI